MTTEADPENRGCLFPTIHDGSILRIDPSLQQTLGEDAERTMTLEGLEVIQALGKHLEEKLAVPDSSTSSSSDTAK